MALKLKLETAKICSLFSVWRNRPTLRTSLDADTQNAYRLAGCIHPYWKKTCPAIGTRSTNGSAPDALLITR